MSKYYIIHYSFGLCTYIKNIHCTYMMLLRQTVCRNFLSQVELHTCIPDSYLIFYSDKVSCTVEWFRSFQYSKVRTPVQTQNDRYFYDDIYNTTFCRCTSVTKKRPSASWWGSQWCLIQTCICLSLLTNHRGRIWKEGLIKSKYCEYVVFECAENVNFCVFIQL